MDSPCSKQGGEVIVVAEDAKYFSSSRRFSSLNKSMPILLKARNKSKPGQSNFELVSKAKQSKNGDVQ
jgi:hypothetical protein